MISIKFLTLVFTALLVLSGPTVEARNKFPETYAIYKAHQFTVTREVLSGFLPASRTATISVLAMHNALNMIDPQYETIHAPAGYVVPRNVDRDAAVYAAHYAAFNYALDTTLSGSGPTYGVGKFFTGALYTEQKTAIDAFYSEAMSSIPEGAAKTNGIALGNACAQALIDARANDGWNVTLDASRPFAAGSWNVAQNFPAPAPGVTDMIYAQWGAVKSWVIPELGAFRPANPPALNSQQYLDDLAVTKTLGDKFSKSRSPEQTRIADFWASDSGRGFGGKVFLALIAQTEFSVHQTGRFLALQYLADAEQTIANSHFKTTFLFWRPVMAIRNGGMGDASLTGLEKLKDPAWTPYKGTPGNPEYPAGHPMGTSTFTSLGKQLFGFDKFPESIDITGTPNLAFVQPRPTVKFSSFSEIEDSVIAGRIYGGMHLYSSNLAGLAVGIKVGNYMSANALLPLRA